jgi:hypothetical protein
MSPPPIRRRLYIVWLVLAILLAGIIVHEVTGIFEPAPPTRTGRLPMFAFREPELGRVQVIHRGRVAALMRDAAGIWFHHGASHGHRHEHHGHGEHPHEEANAPHAAGPIPTSAAMAERIDLMARMLADRRVKPAQSLDHYGLSNPQTMIAFYGRQGAAAAQPLAVLYIGDLLPTRYAYYAMRPGDRELSLIPRYYIALLLALAFGEDQAPTPLPVSEGQR